jgi:hypothetical protein
MAPAHATSQNDDGMTLCPSAVSVATPPLASTCVHLRPERSRERIFCLVPAGSNNVSIDEVTKNATMRVAHAHPPAPYKIVPMAAAAQAPLRVRTRRRYATAAMTLLPAAPVAN